MKEVPASFPVNLQVFAACFLSFLVLMSPIAALAASMRPGALSATQSSIEKSQPTQTQSETQAANEHSSPQNFLSWLLPLGPTVTATMQDLDAGGDGKADLGEIVNYQAVVSNTGTSDATGVTFAPTIDPNTTYNAGSLHASPIAFNDTYNWVGNTVLDTSARGLGSVTANDVAITDTFTLTTLSGVATTQGGTVTLGSNGHFTYTPPVGFTGTDTFNYTIRNSTDATLAGTGTVTINLPVRVWYVQNAAVNGNGLSSSPFNSPVSASSAANASTDIIYVFSDIGANPKVNGNFALDNGQQLLGQGVSLVANSITLFAASSAPTITNSSGSGITLAVGASNTVSGLIIGNCSGSAIASGASFGTLTVSGVAINNGTGQALSLSSGTLSASNGFSGIASTNSSTTGITLSGVGGTLSLSSGSTSITNPSGAGLDLQSSSGSFNFSNTNISGSGGTGVNLVSNSNNITFADLDITPDANQKAIVATNNTGTITTTSGDITTSGAGNRAIDIDGPVGRTPINMTLTSVTTSGAANSISLVDTSGTKFQVTGTTQINTRAGTGVFIDNSTTTNVQLGTTNIPNPSATGGYGIRIEDTSSAVTITSATISGANQTVAQTDSNNDGVADSDGDGDAIFLKSNTGSFTLSGGTLSNCGGDGIDIRGATNISVSNITINGVGLDVSGSSVGGVGGHGIYALDVTGTNSLTGVTITNWETAATNGFRWWNRSGTGTFTLHGCTFSNSETGSGAIIYRGDNTAVMTLNVGGTNGGDPCNFTNLFGEAIGHAAGNSTGSSATANLTVQNNNFTNNAATKGQNSISARNAEAGKATVVISGNTFDGVGRTGADTSGVIDIGGDALLAANSISFSITGNIIKNIGDNIAGSCGGLECHGKRGIDVFVDDNSNISGTLTLDSNVITNVQRMGIVFDVGSTFNGASFAAKITNNRVGIRADNTIDRVGIGDALGAGGENGIRIENRNGNAKNLNILVSNNLVYNGSGAAGSILNSSGMLIRTQGTATMSATTTNNTVNVSNSSTSFGFNVQSSGPAGSNSTMCFDGSGNSISAPGGGFTLAEALGTLNIEQASSAALQSANTGTNSVTIAAGSPTFGLSCASPPAMYKPEKPTPRDYLARMNSSTRPHASQVQSILVAKSPLPGDKMLTSHGYRTSKRASQKGSQPLAAHPSTSLWPSAFSASGPAQAKTRRSASRMMSNHAVVRSRALRSAAMMPPAPPFSLSIGTLPPAKSVTIKFSVTVNSSIAPAVSQLSAQGTVTGTNFSDVLTDDLPGTIAPNEPTITPLSRLDLKLTKTDNVTTTTPGSTLTYVITYSNPGHSASGVVLTETVPVGTTFNAAGSDVNWVETPSGSGIYKLSLGTLASGASGTKNFAVTVNNPAAAGLNSILNTASIADDGSYEPDVNPSDNTAIDTDTLNAAPVFTFSKTDGVTSTTPGSTLTYALNYSNTGNQNATGVVLTETVPVGATYTTTGSSSWSCANGSPAGTVCTLNVGNLNAGVAASTATFAVVVTNPAAAGLASIINNASIADDGANSPSAITASASDTDTLNAVPDLALSKMADTTNAAPGQVITYTLNYANTGTQGATGVVITETVPTHTTFDSAASAPTVWSCANNSAAGTTCTTTIGALAGGGANGVVKFAVKVVAPLPGGATQISNTATIADDGANGADSNTANNTTGSVTTPLDTAPTLGTYADTTVLVSEGTTVTPSVAPADDKPGFTVGVTAPGFTGGLTVDQITGVVSITNAAPAGIYTVTVTATDSISQTATRTFQLTVNKSGTTTALVSSMNPSFVSQNVTFTATVASSTTVTGTPTGSVDFFDGATLICDDAPLSGAGVATCSTSTLSIAGSPHSITATYNGDATFNTSTSNSVSQTISLSLNLTVNDGGDAADLVLDGICDTDAGTVGDQCTLRAAIQETNNAPSADSISFSLPANSTITLSTALNDIDGDLGITGPGAAMLTVERSTAGGTPDFRIFKINSGKTVIISGLTITNGNSVGDNGGGIFNSGTLTINASTVSGNNANQGGGIYSAGGLTIRESTVSGNTSLNQGGGILSFGTMDITNSTVSNNSAALAGGGISVNPGTATLTNVTVTNNRADSDNNGTGAGGGIVQSGGTTAIIVLHNTIVAGNFNENGATDANDDISGAVDATSSFNLIGDGTGMTGITHGSNGNQIGTLGTPIEARLGLLASNGGPTQNHALLPGSPALDAGSNIAATNAILTTDQRGAGFNRFADSDDAGTTATVDIGAFEVQVALSDIIDQATNEDAVNLQVNFNVSNGVTSADVTATSSDTAIVPNPVVSGAASPLTLTINPVANKFGAVTITVTVTSGGQTMTDTFVLTVNAVPDQPSVTAGSTTEDNITPAGQLVISRNAVDGSEVSHFQISGITGGTLFQNNGTTPIANGEFITFAQGNAGLRFLPAPNSVVNGSFTVQGSVGNVTASGPTAIATITVNSVNDQPTLDVITPNPLNILEDAAVQNVWLSGITDGGAEGQTLVVTATSSNTGLIPHPTVTYTSPNGTGSISFAPVANKNGGPVTITVTVTDNGGTANGGINSSQHTFTVNVTGVNDAPTFQIPANPPAVNEDAAAQTVNSFATSFQPGPATATDEGTQTLVGYTVTQTTTTGNLSFISGPSINNAGTLTYTPTGNTSGTATFNVVATDSGSGTAPNVNQSAPISFTITVNAVNDGPVNTVPGAQSVNENATLVFNAANSNLISIADLDADSGQMQITLTAINGTISLSTTAGLAFTVGDGTSDTTMTFTGTIMNVNAALNGLTFTPTASYVGSASVQISTSDQGNTGSGGALTDTDTINITVIGGGTLAFSAATYTVAEDGGTATISVNRTGGSSGEARIDYATSNGTATAGAGADYITTSGTLIFANGVTTRTFTVAVNDDTLDEPDETVNLTLSNPQGTGGLGSPSTAVLTITDNDPAPSISINDVTLNEGNSGTTSFTFNVSLSAASDQIVMVNYQTADGTATVAGSDYQAVPSTLLTFAPGETTKTITVIVNGDATAEPSENFFVNLSGATNATIADNQGLGTILSDDTPVMQFSAANYTVAEDGLRVFITVNRVGDISQPARMDYATDDLSLLTPCSTVTGNASPRCDFATSVGTVRFAAGETSKTFGIPIVNDVYVEGDEVFHLTLSNPVGGDPGTPTTATITITDNDAFVGANPIDTDEFFVRQLYIDILGREPEPGAVNNWLAILNHCAIPTDCDRNAVAMGFVRSLEFRERGYFVYRFFSASLGRIPLYIEFIPDMARASGFMSNQDLDANKEAYVLEFMNRAEFKNLYDSTLNNPTAYVDKLLQTAMLPNHPRRAEWITGLTNGTLTRAQVLRQFNESAEVFTKYYNEAFIVMNYFGFLRRNPDAAYQAWIQIFNNTNDDRVIINGFINSQEYRARFGQ